MKRDIPVIAHRSVNHHLRLRAGTGFLELWEMRDVGCGGGGVAGGA